MLKNRTLALMVGAISLVGTFAAATDRPFDPGAYGYGPGNSATIYTVYASANFIAAGIPELSTWLMMIIGFGGVCVVRARRANPASATA